MSKEEKNLKPITISLRLTVICFVAVLLLGMVDLLTAKKIIEKEKEKEAKANRELIPEGNDFIKKEFASIDDTLKNIFYYYEVLGVNGQTVGYIVSSEGSGYGGKMKVMTAYNNDLSIISSKLLTNSETPGLGKKAEKDSYMEKFKNTNIEENPFPTNKSMLSDKDGDSVTGATITFDGIVQAIKESNELIAQELNR